MLSLASGWRVAEAFGRRGSRGDDRKGDAGRIDLLGSKANDLRLDVTLWFVLAREFTRDSGPNENDELIECLGRELEGEGRVGIAGMA